MNKHMLIKHYLWHQNERDKTYSENTKFKRILENWISDFQDEVRLQFKKQEKINCDRIIQRLLQQNYKNYKLPTHQQRHAIATLGKDLMYWEALTGMEPVRYRIQHFILIHPWNGLKGFCIQNTSVKGITNWKGQEVNKETQLYKNKNLSTG